MKTTISLNPESISKAKPPKNHRSIFLSAMMKALGGDPGNAVAEAFVGGDPNKFREEMDLIVAKVVKKMPNVKK